MNKSCFPLFLKGVIESTKNFHFRFLSPIRAFNNTSHRTAKASDRSITA